MRLNKISNILCRNRTCSRARIISETLMEQFNNGELDEVYVVYTRMENSMVSEVETVKLLPLERSAFGEDSIPADL